MPNFFDVEAVNYVQALHVERLERHIGNGCTQPLLALVKSENEEFYAVVKTKNNIQGILSVVNEWISYNIATELGILMPNSSIAIIDDKTDVGNFIDESNFGSCFCSQYIEKVGILNEVVMTLVDNKEIYEKIILFDHIIYNKDRNKGNLLVTTGKGQKLLYAIDHTHVFKNETIWDRFCLRQGMQEQDYLDKEILDSNGYSLFVQSKNITVESLKNQAKHFKEVITNEFLEEVMANIPKDWNINNNDLEALKEYLLYRVSHIDEMCEMIMDYKDRR